jgi:ATP-dependent Clp protease ATP-binding subunit ClpC
MNLDLFKKFSENLKKVLIMAERISREQGRPTDTEHVLMALLSVKETLALEVLTTFHVTEDRVKTISAIIEKDAASLPDEVSTGAGTPASEGMRGLHPKKEGITIHAKKAIQDAVSLASKNNHNVVDTEHLLLALLLDKSFNSVLILGRLGVNPVDMIKQIEYIFGTSKNVADQNNIENKMPLNPFEEMESDDFIGPMGPMQGMGQTMTKTKKESALSIFTTNLTKLASEGKLDPVIGRNEETLRLVQILSRRTKNNPILVGEPGVGKTSIVEGLAQKLIEGRVPPKLIGKEILSLDMGSLIAGTMYRGQFESRVKKIISEIKKRGNVILFIDEIHTVVGAGSTEGSIDAANLLKPMLARGELRLIGSTTFDEYKKHIEKDAAFERRLQPVKVSEPSAPETLQILEGIKSRYEEHHHVKYNDSALEAAVYLSKRYISDRFLPDKAIDLIDEAAASSNTNISKDAIKLIKLKKQLRDILKQKDELIIAEQYREATLLREKEMKIENEIENIKKKETEGEIIEITDINIAAVVSRWTGVPVSNMNLQEKKRFLDLSKKIKKRIVGQDYAVAEITKAIKRARVGIGNPNRPTGSFIFLGPTGVGKSELAKVIAKEILGSEKSLIKIDMSEFMEKHNVSRLVGAPAGYVGYDEGGKLTEMVRKNPYSVILFDEIEKAHPDVFNILLQIMEDGELTDAKGRKVDFKNTIIIMTSNLGTDALTRQAKIGFNQKGDLSEEYEKLEENVLESVEKHFKPEFINRLDKIIVFKPLDKKSIRKIVDIQIGDLISHLQTSGYNIEVSNDVRNWIGEKGYEPRYGARPIRKVITDYIETPLTDEILMDTFSNGQTLKIELENNKIVLSKKN